MRNLRELMRGVRAKFSKESEPPESSSEQIASDAVELFRSGVQKPLMEFNANSPSVFDINGLKDGCIFRVTELFESYEDPERKVPYYALFVTGKTDESGKKGLFVIHVENQVEDRRMEESGIVPTSGEIVLRRLHPNLYVFRMSEAAQALRYFDWEDSEIEKIEIMFSGSAARKKVDKRAEQPLHSLVHERMRI